MWGYFELGQSHVHDSRLLVLLEYQFHLDVHLVQRRPLIIGFAVEDVPIHFGKLVDLGGYLAQFGTLLDLLELLQQSFSV